MPRTQLLKEENAPLYIRIANRLKDWIDDGTFAYGSRVPSVREMSQKFEVSVSTILQSYDTLEQQGFIEARPQSGYYVKVKSVDRKPILSKPQGAPRFVQSQDAFLDVIHSCGDAELINLGGAVISTSLLPVQSLNRSYTKILRENPERTLLYDRAPGNWEFRQQIARRSVDLGCEYSPDDIISTIGAMEAINLGLSAVTKPGDIVAVESPTYYGILHAIESKSLRVLELPTNSQLGIDLDAFEEKLKKFPVKALVISPSFQNPLGFSMTDEAKEKTVKICAKYGVTIIEDDIYADLNFEGHRPSAIKSFDSKDQVIYCSSFSKTLAPGYRVGWMVPPKKLFATIERLKFSTTVSANSAAQMAVADLLTHHNYDRHLRKLRSVLAHNMHMSSKIILENFGTNTKVSQPKGGCLLWVELPTQVNALNLHQQALKNGISIIPGPLFSAAGKYQNCIRINCGNLWSDQIEKALLRIAELIQKQIS